MEESRLATAIANHEVAPEEWISPTRLRPLFMDDPGIIWIDHYGKDHGLIRKTSEYSFLEYLFEKGAEFEEHWVEHVAPNASAIWTHKDERREVSGVKKTFDHMAAGDPVIVHPVLWWSPCKIFGIPDLLVSLSWIRAEHPAWLDGVETGRFRDHYLPIDLKFSTKLDESDKRRDLAAYDAQVRIYAYMVGQLQGYMPKFGLLFARDRIDTPLVVPCRSALDAALDSDLESVCAKYAAIRDDGADKTPWTHREVDINLGEDDEHWGLAKKIIATDRKPGRDPRLVSYIANPARDALAALGFDNLDAMLKVEPGEVPLESCPRLGKARAGQIRAILEANRQKQPSIGIKAVVPAIKEAELFVDFEYLTNQNVDFDAEWPNLVGKEMVFMIGVGIGMAGDWSFRQFAAKEESVVGEQGMFEEFLTHVAEVTGGAIVDPERVAIYHWSSAENWQSKRSADRFGLPASHILRKLPWVDLQRVFLDAPIGLPGALGFGLKEVASAIGRCAPPFATVWPEELSEGLGAMVMGWRAYEQAVPDKSEEMRVLRVYLEADCRALWNTLRWIRATK